jgi:hypothetical protein
VVDNQLKHNWTNLGITSVTFSTAMLTSTCYHFMDYMHNKGHAIDDVPRTGSVPSFCFMVGAQRPKIAPKPKRSFAEH